MEPHFKKHDSLLNFKKFENFKNETMPDALKTLKFNLITWKVEQLQKWEVYFVGQEWTRREKVANGELLGKQGLEVESLWEISFGEYTIISIV